MNPIEQILHIITENISPLPTEKVPLHKAVNRILRQDAIADIAMPPFNKSAMDGYACKQADLGKDLDMIEEIPAGSIGRKKIGNGQCARIMTGAPIPSGADTVFMLEDSSKLENDKVRCTNPKSKSNICLKGEDVHVGDVLLKKGTKLTARHLPILAAAGMQEIEVSMLPTIGILATGSELVEPNENPQEGQIRNTNSSQLVGQLSEMEIDAQYFGIIEDDKQEIRNAIEFAFKTCQVVLVTGGASNGDFDFIPQIIDEMGFDILVKKVAMKPGKPMTFSKKSKNGEGEKFCFGLSGNPASSLIQFEVFVKPFLYTLCGSSHIFTRRHMQITNTYKRKKSDRFEFVPVYIKENGMAEVIPFNGSAHITAFALADGLMEIEAGINEIPQNSFVYVRQL